MQYYGIKTPGKYHNDENYNDEKSYIWWITDSPHKSWSAFFTYPNKDNNFNASRVPLYDAIRAYKAIGYKCVELSLTEIKEIEQ